MKHKGQLISLACLLKESKLFSYYLFNNILDWTSILLDIVGQGLVYGRLVSPAFTPRFIPEPLQYIRIDEDRDPGLASISDYRSALAFAEVIFLQHFILSAHKSTTTKLA